MNVIKSFVTVHLITYNEEIMIESVIKHYRRMFPGCIIKVHDNYSTDRTVEIAKSYGCEIIYFESIEGRNKLDDREFDKIKNYGWKQDTTDWVIVCDCDELIQITEEELKKEEVKGYHVIKPSGYQMINNKDNNVNLEGMKFGWRDVDYDKSILFNKKYVIDMFFKTGAHLSYPKPKHLIKINEGNYTLCHYKFLGWNHSIKKRDSNNKRWSKWNCKSQKSNKSLYPSQYAPDDYLKEWYSKELIEVPNLK